MRIAIVGGVAGGASAATRARRINEDAEITIFEQGPYISYANCGLPYYAGGRINDANELLLETPESLWDRFRIQVNVHSTVKDIDAASGGLRFETQGVTKTGHFDHFILAPGATPIIPNLPGMERADVFFLRTVPDALRLRDYLEQHPIQHVTVVGAGFIGMEMTEVLHQRGVEVTVVDRAPQILPPLDREIAEFLATRLVNQGIHLNLSNTLAGISGALGHPMVHLSSGQHIAADLVVIGLGVRPAVRLAEAMGLVLGSTGAIQVDNRMRTSQTNVWAAGDAVEKHDLVTNQPRWWPLAGVANKEGRVAGTNAAGGNAVLPGALGTAIVRVAPYTIGMTGLTENTARQEGIPHRVLHTIRGHHAGYYPGARDVLIKLLYHPDTGRILGGQVAGEDGIDKRLDVIATAIHANMTVDALADLDLAYAPPLGAAKDPIVITGMGASNHHQGLTQGLTADDLAQWLDSSEPPYLLDVRDPHETSLGIIPSAHQIPLHDLRGRLTEIPPNKPIVTYCKSGHRSYLASRILRQNGHSTVYSLSGGIVVWELSQPLHHKGHPVSAQ